MSDPERMCVCGHPFTTHEHFRRGSDCGQCGRAVCPRFRAVDAGVGSRAYALARHLVTRVIG